MKDIFLKLMFNIFGKLHNLYKDLPSWPERIKIENIEKLVTYWHDKTEYVMHIRNLKQALNHGLKKLIKWLNLIKMLG